MLEYHQSRVIYRLPYVLSFLLLYCFIVYVVTFSYLINIRIFIQATLFKRFYLFILPILKSKYYFFLLLFLERKNEIPFISNWYAILNIIIQLKIQYC